jgi:hypothetical protein
MDWNLIVKLSGARGRKGERLRPPLLPRTLRKLLSGYIQILALLHQDHMSSTRPKLSPLSAIEAACVKALDEGDAADFRSVVDPASVMRICDMARNALTQDELQSLGKLLDDVRDYIAGHSPMYDDSRDELFSRIGRVRKIAGL